MQSTGGQTALNRISHVVSLWRETRDPDARRFLDDNPELKSNRTLVIDLAYEEFCLRQESGQRVDTAEFCRRFPTVQHSLGRMLDVHRLLAAQSLGFAARDPVEWPEVGQTWLGWRLVEPLGRGAFSRVFLAHEEALGDRKVVVKCCISGTEEAFILGSLSHPNIVPIHSVVHDDSSGLTGICMPFVGQVTLAELIDRGLEKDGNAVAGAANVDLADDACVVGLVERIALGLAEAHARGVVHGDIKPSNILLSFAGEPMLLDFNLSAGPGQGGTRVGGTPPYMAPERLQDLLLGGRQGEETALDPRSDVFSLGVVLLELLTGPLPASVELLTAGPLQAEDWRRITLRPLMSGRPMDARLQGILRKCLDFEPSQRYRDMEVLAADLRELLAARKRSHVRRRSLVAIAVVCVGVVGLTGAVALFPKGAESEANARESLLEKALRTGSKGDFLQAGHKLREMYETDPNEELAAWIGYCFARGDSPESAKRYLKFAVANGGCAESWNNMGYCNTKLLLSEEAKNNFKKALQLDPELQAAHHNLSFLLLNEAMSDSRPVPNDAFEGFRAAVRLGPESARLHYHVALAIAYGGLRGQEVSLDINEHATKALTSESIARSMRQSGLFKDVPLDQLQQDAGKLGLPSESPLLLPPSVAAPISMPHASNVAGAANLSN